MPLSSLCPRVQLLVFERHDPARNMARFYVLSIEPTLFGDTGVIRQWGRIGASGQRRIDLHADGVKARIALDVWLTRKLKRGYVLRKSQARA
jgi:predicted DNA-binding WGR domain protein